MFNEANRRIIQTSTKTIQYGENNTASLAELAIKLSHRRYGVGGDGIIIIDTPEVGTDEGIHGEMIMFNSDGSMAEMCGNGLSCVALYLHSHIYENKIRDINYCNELTIQTGAGVRRAKIVQQNSSLLVQLNMGAPQMNSEIFGKPLVLSYNNRPITVYLHYVSMGNPHVVIFIEDVEFDGHISNNLSEFPVEALGPQVESHELFPDRANVEFVKIINAEQGIVEQRTWERGSGETMACGTGACAVAFMSAETRKIKGDQTIRVKLRGGDLLFDLERKEHMCSQITMYAQPKEVFSGRVRCETMLGK
jgi:diaminopimelate epimerase